MLPKSVRLFFSDSRQVFLTPGVDCCLELHNDVSLQKFGIETEQSANGNRRKKAFSRLFFAQSETCSIDSQGRIRVTQRLSDLAKLKTKVSIVGVGGHWEIWEFSRWEQFLLEHQHGFDQLAELAFEKGMSVESKNQHPELKHNERPWQATIKPR